MNSSSANEDDDDEELRSTGGLMRNAKGKRIQQRSFEVVSTKRQMFKGTYLSLLPFYLFFTSMGHISINSLFSSSRLASKTSHNRRHVDVEQKSEFDVEHETGREL